MITKLYKNVIAPIIIVSFLSAFSVAAVADDWSKLSKKKLTTLGLYDVAAGL